MVIDLGEVTFLDMSGLRVIAEVVARQRAYGSAVAESNTAPMILRTLRVTNLVDLVELIDAMQAPHADGAEAVAAAPTWRHRYF